MHVKDQLMIGEKSFSLFDHTSSAMLKKWVKLAAYLIMLIAIVLKFKLFLECRDLFIDEINLSRNIITLPFHELFGNLLHHQHAPPFLLFIIKGLTILFGITEYSLRSIPLVASLFSLILFYKLSIGFIKNWAILFPICLFGFSIYIMEYSVSVKQYSTDIFFTLAFVYWTLKLDLENVKAFLIFVIAASLALWFSMPFIFTLASIGFYLLLTKSKKPFDEPFIKCLIMGACWLISFGILYIVNIKGSLESDVIISYHQRDFIPFPSTFEKLIKFKDLIISVFRSMVGKTTVPILFSIMLFFLAFAKCWQQKKAELLLLIGPFFLSIIASMLGYYAFAVRLSLFFLPLLMIMMGIGLGTLITQTNKLKKTPRILIATFLAGLTLLALQRNSGIAYLFKPFHQVQTKNLIQELSTLRKPTEALFVSLNAQPAYLFYTKLHKNPLPNIERNVFLAEWDSNYAEAAKSFKAQGIKRAWFFDAHSFGADKARITKERDAVGKILNHLSDKEANLYYLELQ